MAEVVREGLNVSALASLRLKICVHLWLRGFRNSASTTPVVWFVAIMRSKPYTKRGAVVSTQYNQTGLLRTMELMLAVRKLKNFAPLQRAPVLAAIMLVLFVTAWRLFNWLLFPLPQLERRLEMIGELTPLAGIQVTWKAATNTTKDGAMFVTRIYSGI